MGRRLPPDAVQKRDQRSPPVEFGASEGGPDPHWQRISSGHACYRSKRRLGIAWTAPNSTVLAVRRQEKFPVRGGALW